MSNAATRRPIETQLERNIRSIINKQLTEEELNIDGILSYINLIIFKMSYIDVRLRQARMIKDPFQSFEKIKGILHNEEEELTHYTDDIENADFKAAKSKVDKVYLDLLRDRRKDYSLLPQAIGGRRKSKKNRKNKKIKTSRKARRSS